MLGFWPWFFLILTIFGRFIAPKWPKVSKSGVRTLFHTCSIHLYQNIAVSFDIFTFTIEHMWAGADNPAGAACKQEETPTSRRRLLQNIFCPFFVYYSHRSQTTTYHSLLFIYADRNKVWNTEIHWVRKISVPIISVEVFSVEKMSVNFKDFMDFLLKIGVLNISVTQNFGGYLCHRK